MSAQTSSLRWVRYDGVYYAAMFVPASEAPVTVPAQNSFVFFLDGESGAVVPDADVLPFDPSDKEKAENPAAVAGVAIANEILRGFGHDAEQPTPYDDSADVNADDVLLAQLLEGAADDDLEGDEDATQRAERRRLEKEEKLRRKEERAARKAEKKKKKRERDWDSDEENPDNTSSGEEEDAQPSQTRARKAQQAVGDSHWDELADLLEADDDDRGVGGLLATGGGALRGMAAPRGGRARDGLAEGLAALMTSGSPVAVYLAEIRHNYQVLQEEAKARGMVLSASEQAVVTAIDEIMRRNLATAQYVQHEIEKLEESVANGEYTDGLEAATTTTTSKKKNSSKSKKAVNAVLVKEQEAAEAAVSRLSSVPHIELLVKQLAQLLPGPDAPRTEKTRRRAGPAGAATSTFMDTGLALHLHELSSSEATPLPMTADLAAKLREQRVYRERVLSYRKGLGKGGLTAPAIKPLENWNRSRELMVMAPPVETQCVRPNGYVPRRYSTLTTKREAVALRRLSAGLPAGETLDGRASASTLAFTGASASSFADGKNGDAGANSLAQHSFLSSQQDLMSTFMTNTRRARQSVPAYYDFNTLRPSLTGSRADGAAGNGLSAASGHGGGEDESHLVFRSTADAGLFMSQLDDDEDEVGGVAHGLPPGLVPQLAVNFDPHAVFAVGADDIRDEQERAARLAGRSQMYSNSVYLPSEESHWFSSVVYHGASAADDEGSRDHGTVGSRHRSRASSVGHGGEGGGDASQGGRTKSKGAVEDWRDSAKRAILQRLTLYLKGAKDFPAVLDEPTFKRVAKKLLERAVRAESARSGASMVLRVNNATMAFTKKTERQLQAAVDRYVKSHFVDQSDAVRPAEEGVAPAQPPTRHSDEDSPVYDN